MLAVSTASTSRHSFDLESHLKDHPSSISENVLSTETVLRLPPLRRSHRGDPEQSPNASTSRACDIPYDTIDPSQCILRDSSDVILQFFTDRPEVHLDGAEGVRRKAPQLAPPKQQGICDGGRFRAFHHAPTVADTKATVKTGVAGIIKILHSAVGGGSGNESIGSSFVIRHTEIT